MSLSSPLPARAWRRISKEARALPSRAPTSYAGARDRIQVGDVLLFRGRGLVAKLIGGAGRTRYSHAALVVARREDFGARRRLLVAEFRELRGSRVIALSKAIEGADVDLFRLAVEPAWGQRAKVHDLAWDLALDGRPYSWATIARMALARLPLFLLKKIPGVRRLLPARTWSEDDAAEAGAFVCSVFVAHVWRKAGSIDLVPRLADDSTEPGDLARSALLEFVGTLTAEDATSGTPAGLSTR